MPGEASVGPKPGPQGRWGVRTGVVNPCQDVLLRLVASQGGRAGNLGQAAAWRAPPWTKHPFMPVRIASLLFAICQGLTAEVPSPVVITFLHVNDTHGVGVTPDASGDCPLARAATIIKRIRAEQGPARVFLSIGGDIGVHSHDEDLLTVKTGGMAEVLALGHLSPDVMTPGNHEFDHGLAGLQRLEAASTFPWISANVYPKGGKEPVLHGGASVRFAVGGVRVVFFGLSPGPNQQYNVLLGAKDDVDTRDEVEVGSEQVALLRPQADLLVALTHIGTVPDEALAKAAPGIDLVLGAHSHTENPGMDVGSTRIVQARWHYQYVARVDARMVRSDGKWKVETMTSALIPTEGEKPDPEMVKVLQDLQRQVEAGK